MEIFVNTNYDFIKWRFIGVAFSIMALSALVLEQSSHLCRGLASQRSAPWEG